MSRFGKRPLLSRFIAAARSDVPGEDDLRGALGALSPSSGEPRRVEPAVPVAKTAAAAKLVTTGLVVLAVAAGVIVATTSSRSIPEPATSGRRVAPPLSVAEPAAASGEPLVPARRKRAESMRAAVEGARPRMISSAGAEPGASPPASVAPEPGRHADAESTLVEAARRALHEDPTRTLALAADHARLFPSGLLSLEREALSIHALALLGRKSEARARLAELEKANPRSIHVTRLHRVLGDDVFFTGR